jgi:hypothetical protein
MDAIRKLQALSVVLAFGTSVFRADAQELLGNANFEALAPNLLGWGLEETITGSPGTSVNSGEIVGFANQPMEIAGESGLWLRAFEGNVGSLMGMNKKTNVVLSQSVAGTAGETYTLSGWARFQQNYSGGVDTLHPASPSGAIPSPTQSLFEVSFLNGSNAVIGSPVTLDLRTVQGNDNLWHQQMLPATIAPAGTASVRVRAIANDMVFNVDPEQSAFYDTFSLKAASAPSTELLTNGNLNFVTGAPVWTRTGNAVFNTNGFANHTPGGTVGTWFQSFMGGDAAVTQTVPGTAGGNYTFSGWSKWETNYSGGQATATQTKLELAFLDGGGLVIGTPVTLDLRTQQMNGMDWKQHTLMGTAPTGTVNVRVTGFATGMENTTGQQGAFFDDFSLNLAAGFIPGDYDGSHAVGGGDLNLVLNNWNATVPPVPTGWIGDQPDPGVIGGAALNKVLNNWGNTGGSGASFGAVPEPGCLLLGWTAVLFGGLGIGRLGHWR